MDKYKYGSFKGGFRIAAKKFLMRADIFVLADNAISFEFSGSDDVGGAFKVRGTAFRGNDADNFVAIVRPVYVDLTLGFKGTITFTEVDPMVIGRFMREKYVCRVVGAWDEGKSTYHFGEHLPVVPKKRVAVSKTATGAVITTDASAERTTDLGS